MPVRVAQRGSVSRLVVRGPFNPWMPDYPPDELPPDGFSTADNVLVQQGRVQKMPGYALWTQVAANTVIRALARFQKESGTQYGIVVTNDSIYEGTGDTFSSIKSGLTGSRPVDWTIHDDQWIMTNGADLPQSYDGTTVAALATAQIARLCANFNDRLFLGYTTESTVDYPYRLRYSATGDPTDWTDGFVHDLISGSEPPEFSGLTALAPVGASLACFKANSIWRLDPLTYSPWYSAQQVVSGIGCVGLDAICTVPEGLIFVGESDVYFWNGSGAPQPLTTGLREDLGQYIVPERYERVTATWDRLNDRVLVGVSTEGVNEPVDRVYVYDRREERWSVVTGVSFQAIGTLAYNTAVTFDNYTYAGSATATMDDDPRTFDEFVSEQDERLCGADADGNLFMLWRDADKTTIYNRNAAAYTGQVIFGYLDFGRPDLVKRVERIQPLNVTGGGGSHNLVMYLGVADNPYQTPTWGDAINFPVNTTTRPWKFCDVKGRYIVPRFETTGADEPFELSGVVLDAVMQGEF